MSLLESNENTSLLDNASATVAVPSTAIPSSVVERSAFVVPTATSDKRRADKPLQPVDPWMGGLDWGTIIWFSIVHAGCLASILVPEGVRPRRLCAGGPQCRPVCRGFTVAER